MVDREKLVELMGRTGLFGGLTVEDRQTIAKLMREQSFEAGQVIFSRGDSSREVFMIVDGRVRLSVVSLEGRELSFHLAEQGAVFGEIAALDGGSRTAFATAVSAVKAMTLSHTEMNRLVTSIPLLAGAVIRLLCARLREADNQLEGVALHRIEVRLARFLVGLIRQSDRDLVKPKATLDLGMSQTELSMLLGATRPKVNAALAQLEEQGAITRRDQSIDCDVEQLKLIAETD
jgi:CRP/FNR family transcriptional regulator, cyclic AMP receptor protein